MWTIEAFYDNKWREVITTYGTIVVEKLKEIIKENPNGKFRVRMA